MQLDECIELPAEQREVERAMELSLRWAERSQRAFATHGQRRARRCSASSRAAPTPSCAAARRKRSSPWICRLRRRRSRGRRGPGHDAGDARRRRCRSCPRTSRAISWASARRSTSSSRCARGIDMFDCVLPTRNGRHGLAFTWDGKVNLRNACHADDPAPARPAELVPGRARLFARLPAPPRASRASTSAPCCCRGSTRPSTRS